MTLSTFPIALGCMSLTGTWNPAEMDAARERRAIAAFEAAYEAGITLYDHADIYGGGTCEEVFAKCLAAVPGARSNIAIATKGGLGGGQYNLGADYLASCIERSLRRMNIEYIDLYQLHRPDPMTHPSETARAMNEALATGKIRAVGVSNYYPEQVRALQQYLDAPIASNQVSISLNRLDPIYEGVDSGNGMPGDGVLDQCMALKMVPLAYTPLGKGMLARGAGSAGNADGATEKQLAVSAKLSELAEKHNATPGQVALAWLTAHPAGIVPLVGSGNPDHIREGAGAAKITLDRAEWFALWSTAWGRGIP